MKQRLRHLLYFIILIAVDQGTKYWARTYVKDNGPVIILPHKLLNLQYHENTGAVWGIMSGQIVFLIALTLVLFLLLLFLYFKIPTDRRLTPVRVIWVFIMAGAIGNFIDRITLKHVVDFIYFEFIDFPLFNFADTFLTLSCILLLLLALFYYKDKDFAFIDEMFSRKKKNGKDNVNKAADDTQPSNEADDNLK